jgi:hypothetical protein
MGITQHDVAGKCVLVPPVWRVAVFVLIQIVVVVLVTTGCDAQTALTCAAGSGLAAAHVAGRLFGTARPAREA